MIISALVDVRPLRRVPDFRRLWLGSTASALGGQLASFAVILYVWESTKSAAIVGALGLAIAAPLIIFGLVGGTIADAMDRRRLVIITTAGQLVVAMGMAAVALLHLEAIWIIFVLVAASSGFGAVGAPARRTFIPRLLPRDQLAAGLALNHLSFQAAMLLGPALAGLITAQWGIAACFVVDAVTFLAAGYGVLRLPPMAPSGETSKPGPRAVWVGIRLTVHRPVLGGAFLADLCVTLLAMPMALFPVINEERYGGSPETLGLLMSAVGLGGIVASVLSGLTTRVRRSGLVMLATVTTWGLALIGVGLVSNLAVVLVLLGIAGAADTWGVVARGGIVQAATPESYRGRITALEHVVGVAGPHLGNFRAGLVASLGSAGGALIIGGAMCVAGVALTAKLVPALRTFDVTQPSAAEQSAHTGVDG